MDRSKWFKGRRTYLYRAVDSRGQTVDLPLSAKRDAAAAKRFIRKNAPQISRFPCKRLQRMPGSTPTRERRIIRIGG
jgi:hypothetical protein